MQTRQGKPKDRPARGPNIMKFYNRSCYSEYDESPNGFYAVFGALFKEIDEVCCCAMSLDPANNNSHPLLCVA
jgi:hypothetical protein